LIACLLSLVNGECPLAETLAPCTCQTDIYFTQEKPSLHCEGIQINDLSRIFSGKLKATAQGGSVKFAGLYISNTSISSIELNTFEDAVFEAIILTNNLELMKIDVNAFIKSANNLQVFNVINSPKLVSAENLFAIVNILQVKQEIELSKLGIEEVPDNAFSLNPSLYVVIMDGNSRLRRIGKSAFTQLTNLSTIIMLNNNIDNIDSNGLTFMSNNHNSDTLLVVLNSNQLTENSFNKNWSDNQKEGMNIQFLLNVNKIKSLPENIFKSVLLSPAIKQISVGGNALKCDCSMKWIFAIKNQIENKLSYADCTADKLGRSVFDLKVEEFGQC